MTGIAFYIFALLGLLLFVVAVQFIKGMRLLLSLRFARGSIEMHSRDEMPQFLNTVFAPAGQHLERLGFQYSTCLRSQSLIKQAGPRYWALLYFHPDRCSYAMLTVAEKLGLADPVILDFFAIDAGSNRLVTLNGRLHEQLPHPPTIVHVDPYTADIDLQWREHLEAVEENIPQPQALPAAECVELMAQFLQQELQYLLDKRYLVPDEDSFRLRYATAFRLLRQLLRGQRKGNQFIQQQRQQATEQEFPEERAKTEAVIYARVDAMQRQQPLPWLAKFLFFIGSIALFALAFGFVLSWEFVIALIAVVLFHELGHLLAMYVFGYRDLQILFIPALGAVAVGKENDASIKPWQKLIVYLAGPVPGLIVGYLLWLWAPVGIIWIEYGIFLLLIINYLNLLPFTPLDGGQIINLLLLNNKPQWQRGFAVFSAAIIAVSAWYLSAWILLFIAALLFLGNVTQTWQTKAQASWQQQLSQRPELNSDYSAQLIGVFTLLQQPDYQRLNSEQHYQIARTLLSRTGTALLQKIGWLSRSLWLTVYALILVVPLILLGWHTFADRYIDYGLPDWSTQLEQAESPAQYWQTLIEAGDWHAEQNDYQQAEQYYQQAELKAQSFTTDDQRWATLKIRQARIFYDNPEQQRDLYQQALNLQQQQHGEISAEVAATLVEISATYGREEIASRIALLEQARQIYNQLQQTTSERQTLFTLAYWYEQQGQVQTAEAYLKQLLPPAADDYSPEVVSDMNYTLSRLANLYIRQYEPVAVIPKLEQIIKRQQTLEEMLPAEGSMPSEAITETLTLLGWAQVMQNNWPAAETVFRQTLARQQELNEVLGATPGSNFVVLPSLSALAYTLLLQQRTAEAQDVLQAMREFFAQDDFFQLDDYIQSLQRHSQSWPGQDLPEWMQIKLKAELEITSLLSKS